MQFSKNTSISSRRGTFNIIFKVALLIVVIIGLVVLLSKIEFPSPNKEIEKIIPNEKLKIVK
jgi:hypothetical protein